jgi:hypothetical protein
MALRLRPAGSNDKDEKRRRRRNSKASGNKTQDCFAAFIWGQWRIAVKGPERAEAVLATADLKEG